LGHANLAGCPEEVGILKIINGQISQQAEAHRRKLEQVAVVPMVMITTFHRKREADPTEEADDDGFF
jgi:hypothetical protein